MHSVLVTLNIQAGHEHEGGAFIEAKVIPAMREVPGLVAAYWLDVVNGQGLTIFLLHNEEAARSFAERIPNAPMADFATFAGVELREVIAQV